MRRKKNTNLYDYQQAYLLAQQGHFDRARLMLEKILRHEKSDAQSWYLLASIHARLGQCAESEKAYRNALRHNNTLPDIHMNLATVLSLQGKHAQAEQHFSKQLELQASHQSALLGLARATAAQGKLADAVSRYENYFRYAPESLEPIIELGNLFWHGGDINQAQAWYLRAVACNSNSPLGLNNVGLTYQHQGHIDTAIEYYKKAIKANPDFLETHYNLGTALTYLGDYDAAIEYLKQVIHKSPNHEQAIGALADAYHRSGDQEAAYDLVKPIAQAGSYNVNIAVAYAQSSSQLKKDDDALSGLQTLVNSGVLHDSAKRLACFTLGKLYDRKGRYEQAFKHYATGNALVRGGYDIATQKIRIEKLEQVFDHSFLSQQQTGINSDRPVFIVGMPRSGTSLVEQILSSHSQVFGAGELTFLPELVGKLSHSEAYSSPYPESLHEASSSVLSELAQCYLNQIEGFSPDATRITDKLPDNFLHLGLIATLFPNAHIIHCHRNPVDTCLSCYFQNFGGTHTYSADLKTLTEYYRLYERIMTHWHAVLPLPILDFRYEELVQDQEGMSRRLVEFCDLDWEDACLEYYTSQRKTSTASYEQANQPLYKHSVARWKHYQHWVGELLEGLETGN